MRLIRTTLPVFLEHYGEWLFRTLPRLLLITFGLFLLGGLWIILSLGKRAEKLRYTEDSVVSLKYTFYYFYYAYDRFPFQLPGNEQSAGERNGWMTTDKDLIRVLLGFDETENPEGIAFNEWPKARQSDNGEITLFGGILEGEWMEREKSGAFVGPLVDAWGKCYRIRVDYDGDGWIPNPIKDATGELGPSVYFRDEERIRTSILVVSAGPDRKFRTWNDNIVATKRVSSSKKQ